MSSDAYLSGTTDRCQAVMVLPGPSIKWARERLLTSRFGNYEHLPVMAASMAAQYGSELRIVRQVEPSKIVSVLPILNSDPQTIQIEVLCSLCDELAGCGKT